MKKLIIVAALSIPVAAWCATTQAQNLGVVALSVRSMTAAQIAISTSTAKGEIVYCSDCGANGAVGTICVSTSTSRASFVLSTGTVCK